MTLAFGILTHAVGASGQTTVDRPVSFAVLRGGYRLVQERYPATIPAGHGRLVLIGNGKRLAVGSMAAFLNKVSIASGDDALAFVRLRTRPYLYGAWDVLALEVALSKGDEPTRDGYTALVSGATMKRLKLAPASVQRVGGGYLIKRYVLEDSDRKPYRLFRDVERVGRKGEYKRIGHRLVSDPLVLSIRWSIPLDD